MNLDVGQEISCDEIISLEKFHWKHKYGEEAWEKEKLIIERVKEIIESKFSRIEVIVTGFGADSNEFIPEHPDESGKPDLVIKGRDTGREYCMLEVTGTDVMRGGKYWIRPDKLRYAQDHPEKDVWICLHYSQPRERIIFVKPEPLRKYLHTEIEIRGSVEHFVEFSDSSEELRSAEGFFAYLLSKREI
ncbi:hypothetical protein U8326_06155 [Tsuneonella sp. CC-YZS046]|uniref:hypothetical protein n=1 Tax=Tsuneonella sp. CC-YZS046 TaxID=3042152 RepID=UPI002D78AE09|nr:hypothetical protein [Tsuneonella sp. CC-YZS046]WRO67736.1 hypothetical protein U8326_06155 [Tsuneonella sp. CC-YZS046]